jgi:predicted nucleotidyltransferase
MSRNKVNKPINKVDLPGNQSDTSSDLGPVNTQKNDLASLFGSNTRVLVIWTLLNNPDDGLTQADIARATNADPKDIQRALDILKQLNLACSLTTFGVITSLHEAANLKLEEIERTSVGTRRYRLNKDHPWVPGLKIILENSHLGSVNVLRQELIAFPVKKVQPDMAFVFGSFAVGGQTQESDIDLIVIGYHDRPALAELIDKVERKIGRNIDYFEYTQEEWVKALRENDFFANSIMKKPKVFLIGHNERLEDINRTTAG